MGTAAEYNPVPNRNQLWAKEQQPLIGRGKVRLDEEIHPPVRTHENATPG
jgi:hypothetical protein